VREANGTSAKLLAEVVFHNSESPMRKSGTTVSIAACALAATLSLGTHATHALAQTAAIAPDSLVLVTCGPQSLAELLSIGNRGTGVLAWSITRTPRPWLTITPTRGDAPSTLTVAANAASLAPGAYADTIEITTNDTTSRVHRVPVWLRVTSPCPGPGAPPVPGAVYAEYDVEFRYDGYTGDLPAYPDCPVKLTGSDVLRGIVRGWELPTSGEDQEYNGTLSRATSIDYCITRGVRTRDDSDRRFCPTTLFGHARMNIEITVYGEADRGAWIKSVHDGGPASSSVFGLCHPQDMAEIQQEYPASDHGGGASPTGIPIDDAGAPVTFVDGNGLARLRVGTYPPAPQSPPNPGEWVLHVIRKIR
jgi:hypothetical protein